jgi:hypothetical protein
VQLRHYFVVTVVCSEKESPPTRAGEVSGGRAFQSERVPKLGDSVPLAKVEFKCGV